MTPRHRLWFATSLVAISASIASAQTALNASQLAFRSGGTVASGDVTLNSNGYLGTYVTLAAPGQVTFNVNAAGVADAGIAPRLNLVVDDFKQSFDVAATANVYTGAVTLPAGTHLVRLEFDNDAPTAAARALTFKTLTVNGATVANAATNANALDAANTYINHFRKGHASIALTGPGDVPLLQGTQVRAQMARNAFNFGGTVSGSSLNDAKDMLGATNPAAGTEQQKFQDFVKKNFNMIVGSNSGKWANNESTQNNVNMSLPDRQLGWAIANNKRTRMHNLIWGSGATGGNQQPAWVNTLIASAAGGNATAKTNLRTAISNRIKYYAGTTGNRSLKYTEIDGLNESLHNPSYMNIFGNSGMADIYAELNAALAATGSNAKTYVNEYNVLQYAPASVSATGVATGSDAYANYFRQHIDDLRAAGTNLGGIGVQYYANYTQTGSNAHSAATIQKALGNLSVTGLPISMTEFGGAGAMTKADSAAGAQVLDDAMRMFYGTPNATTFLIWGWWDLSAAGTAYPPAALLDNSQGNAILTPMGERWQQLMAEFSTDVTSAVGADGKLAFDGFYGAYNIGNQAGFSNLTLAKGTRDYTLKLNAPPSWSLFNPNASTGSWATAANWTGGTPDGVGVTAHFLAGTAGRTIALDTNVTLGQINFDGAAQYTIAGAGTLRLEATAGEAALNVIDGSHEIAVPVTLASDARAVVRNASSTLIIRALADAPLRTLTKSGAGTLAVDHIGLQSLDINAGTVAMLPGTGAAPRINVVHSLSIADGASLDIGDSIWAIDYDPSTGDPTSTIRALVLPGRTTPSGIRSTLSNADARKTIGYAEASALPAGVLGDASFDANTLIFRATYAGDSNLDGAVDFDDLLVLAQHYDPSASGRSWSDGDSNYDGRVDFSDLLTLAQNFGIGSAVLRSNAALSGASDMFKTHWELAQSLIPEPTMLTGVSLTALSACRVRR